MSAKLTKAVYDIPEVQSACLRCEQRYQNTGEHWAVYVDPETPERIWTTPSDDPVRGLVCIFDTADDGKLIS